MACKISELAENIIKTNKMSVDEVIDYIGESMENGETQNDTYYGLYTKAYGMTITKDLADKWVKSMAITDSSDRVNGMKWTYDSAIEVGSKLNIDWHKVDKIEYYVVLNMMYSDYYSVAKQYDISDALFFGRLAKAWLCDEDADENKLFNYFFVVCMS